MATIQLDGIILQNRDLEIGNINSYELSTDLIVGENSTVFFRRVDRFSVSNSGIKIRIRTTTSKIQFDSLLEKTDVDQFIKDNIIDESVTPTLTGDAVLNSLQISSDSFPCLLGSTKVKTTNGFVAANKLKNDSIIITQDNREVPIVNLYCSEVLTSDKNSPYIIPAHYFKRNYPKKQFMISPLHAIATNKKATEWFIPREHGSKLKRMENGNKIEYYHIELPNWLTDHLVLEGETLVESYGVNFHKGLESVFYIRSRETGYYKRDLEMYKKILSVRKKEERKNKKIIFE